MEYFSPAAQASRELCAALSAHYEVWKRENMPGDPAGPLEPADLRAAFLGGYHLCLSLLTYLPLPPARLRAFRQPHDLMLPFLRPMRWTSSFSITHSQRQEARLAERGTSSRTVRRPKTAPAGM